MWFKRNKKIEDELEKLKQENFELECEFWKEFYELKNCCNRFFKSIEEEQN